MEDRTSRAPRLPWNNLRAGGNDFCYNSCHIRQERGTAIWMLVEAVWTVNTQADQKDGCLGLKVLWMGIHK